MVSGEYQFFAGEDGFCSLCRTVAANTDEEKFREECLEARYRRVERRALPTEHPVNKLADSMCMPAEAFAAVVSISSRISNPTLLAAVIDELGADGFLSAQQAAQLIATVPSKQNERWVHVICARVVDAWRLTSAQHSYGACYYGMDAGAVLQASSVESLARAVFMNRASLRQFRTSNLFDGRNIEAMVASMPR